MPQDAATNATLFYHPDGFSTERTRLMGRQAAGESFLKGWVQHSGVDTLYCCTDTPASAEDFAQRVKAMGATVGVRNIPMLAPEGIAQTGCLFYPGPNFEPFAWRRRRGDPRAYSLCGLTHTTASHVSMEALAGLLTAPLQDWDAVICSSKVVRDSAIHLLEAHSEYLRQRVGATSLPLPQLPVIPLGIDAEAFQVSDARRFERRAQLGIAPQDIVLLFVGRLSYHAKAHPLPMYLAAEQAAKTTGARVHLVQSGWFANDFIEKAFREGAAQFCPSVNAIFVDGRKPENRAEIWGVGDIFTSLSDNIQETFGLVPLEAMAAGLPVVVSDWNGYRDTVRDGLDGFRIPTMMPPAPLGADLARRYDDGIDSYDAYCGHTSQLVSVDVDACTDAYVRLIKDAGLRKRMGTAGRTRAHGEFDWKHIVRRYQELFRDLAERRTSARVLAPRANNRQSAHPVRTDPFGVFGSYPTALISIDHEVSLRPGATVEVLKARRTSPLFRFVDHVFLTDEEVATLFAHLEKAPSPVRDLLPLVPQERRGQVLRGLVWLQKLDLVKLVTRPQPAAGQ